MRDRNHLTQTEFNIQLTKSIFQNSYFKIILKQEEYFSHKSSLWSSDPEIPNSSFEVRIPRDFRLLRALSISQWFFPEELHFLYYLRLEEENFNRFNRKQQIELSILLSSKENCLKYLFLTERYSSNEIFGNFLGNDLKDLRGETKILFIPQSKARKKIFRRGPKDKGSRRSDSSVRIIQEEEEKDIWLKEKEILLNKKRKLLLQTCHRIQLILENNSDSSELVK
jgi:hypothetical protein